MEIAIKAVQLILSLSLLVIIHEFGHFLFAKLFGCRVEKFYLFFDYKFSLFKKKYKGTEFGVGWIPFGGYVKISGMVDESMDKKQLAEAPKPWEYRSKPAWQRFFIIVGGVMMNVILAALIYIGIVWSVGDNYVKTEDARGGFAFSTVAQDMGFRNGDMILSVDGEKVENSMGVAPAILFGDERVVELMRDGQKMTITVTDSMVKNMLNDRSFASLRIPPVIESVGEGSVAESALFKADDRIVSIGGVKVDYVDEVSALIRSAKAGDSLKIDVIRGCCLTSLVVVPDTTGRMGVIFDSNLEEIFTISHKDYTFWEAVPEGISRGYSKIGEYIAQLKLIFTPETEAYKQVGGFIAMGKIFPGGWDWLHFWNITALLSIMLAVMNILPIPGLDGGHMVFIIFEMITGRAPSQKFMEVAQYIGFFLIISLVLLANGSDIVKLFS